MSFTKLESLTPEDNLPKVESICVKKMNESEPTTYNWLHSAGLTASITFFLKNLGWCI